MNSNLTKNGVFNLSTFSEVFANPYDIKFYIEPDNSVWIRIIHHNNPTDYKFASTDTFNSSVYTDANRWFYASLCYKITNNIYEFMIKQKTTSDATETKYRWIQTKNPYEAAFGDVDAADVTKITTEGYSTHSSYGGIYKSTRDTTYFCANNSNSNDWWGALGSWTAYGGGIPGYAGVAIQSGYMDLYLRIDNQISDKPSIFKNAITANQFYEI